MNQFFSKLPIGNPFDLMSHQRHVSHSYVSALFRMIPSDVIKPHGSFPFSDISQKSGAYSSIGFPPKQSY